MPGNTASSHDMEINGWLLYPTAVCRPSQDYCQSTDGKDDSRFVIPRLLHSGGHDNKRWGGWRCSLQIAGVKLSGSKIANECARFKYARFCRKHGWWPKPDVNPSGATFLFETSSTGQSLFQSRTETEQYSLIISTRCRSTTIALHTHILWNSTNSTILCAERIEARHE